MNFCNWKCYLSLASFPTFYSSCWLQPLMIQNILHDSRNFLPSYLARISSLLQSSCFFKMGHQGYNLLFKPSPFLIKFSLFSKIFFKMTHQILFSSFLLILLVYLSKHFPFHLVLHKYLLAFPKIFSWVLFLLVFYRIWQLSYYVIHFYCIILFWLICGCIFINNWKPYTI